MALYAFDSTWNSDDVADVQDTNVVRFKELYRGNNAEYLEGVGTRFGRLGAFLGGLFGTGGRTRIFRQGSQRKHDRDHSRGHL